MEGDSQRMEVLAWRDVDSKREETALESRGKNMSGGPRKGKNLLLLRDC